MSIKLLSQAWELDLPPEEQHLLLCLCDYAADDGTQCFPGVPRLAWRLGKSERAVRYTLRRLEARGVIRALRYRHGGRRGQHGVGLATEWAINLGAVPRKAPFGRHQQADDPEAYPEADCRVDADDIEPTLQPVSPYPATDVTLPCNPLPPNRHEPSVEPSSLAADIRRLREDDLAMAVCEATEIDLSHGLTRRLLGQLNAAVSDLRLMRATPAEVAVRASEYHRCYPEARLTPLALAKHWPMLHKRSGPPLPKYWRAG